MGRNTHAIPYVLVVNANAVNAESVEVARLPPGAPVVSISTYVELSTCAMGVALFEGVMEGVPLTLAVFEVVPLELLEPVPDNVLVGVSDKEEPPEAVPVGVPLPLPVGDPLTVRVPVSVLEPVRVCDGVPEGVNVDEGVPDDEAPPTSDGVAEGV